MIVAGGEQAGADPRRVFVIHGRNEPARKGLFDFLRSIGLDPIEWSEAIRLTGKGSPYIGQVLDAAFGTAQAVVVLQTPDDVAHLHESLTYVGDPECSPQMQPRPNVLFEAGMAMGRDEDRTVIVEMGEIKVFSDIHGRHVVRLGNDVKKRQELATRLETAGCAVRLTGTDWHDAGDLTPPAPPGGGLPLGRKLPSSRPAASHASRRDGSTMAGTSWERSRSSTTARATRTTWTSRRGIKKDCSATTANGPSLASRAGSPSESQVLDPDPWVPDAARTST
jgi:hypothetical protein